MITVKSQRQTKILELIAKKDIEDVLKQFKGHDLKFAIQLILISAYEFTDIFCWAHFFPSVYKKYNLKLDEK